MGKTCSTYEIRNTCKIKPDITKERDYFEDLGGDGRIISDYLRNNIKVVN